jgi:hypothetical protein
MSSSGLDVCGFGCRFAAPALLKTVLDAGNKLSQTLHGIWVLAVGPTLAVLRLRLGRALLAFEAALGPFSRFFDAPGVLVVVRHLAVFRYVMVPAAGVEPTSKP